MNKQSETKNAIRSIEGATMNKEAHDIILNHVAEMRKEAKIAPALKLGIKQLLSRGGGVARRYGELLSGSKLRALNDKRRPLENLLDRVGGRYNSAFFKNEKIKSEMALRAKYGLPAYTEKGYVNFDTDGIEKARKLNAGAFDTVNGMNTQYRANKETIRENKSLHNRILKQLGRNAQRIDAESRAVNNTRLATGSVGATGLGGAIYAANKDDDPQKSASYVEGFRKTAEAFGFSADALEKDAAGLGALIGKGVGMLGKAMRNPSQAYGAARAAVGKAGTRLGELVAGGNETLQTGYNPLQKTYSSWMKNFANNKQYGDAWTMLKAKFNLTKDTLSGKAGDRYAKELAKVYGARAGVGLTAGGALYGGSRILADRQVDRSRALQTSPAGMMSDGQ